MVAAIQKCTEPHRSGFLLRHSLEQLYGLSLSAGAALATAVAVDGILAWALLLLTRCRLGAALLVLSGAAFTLHHVLAQSSDVRLDCGCFGAGGGVLNWLSPLVGLSLLGLGVYALRVSTTTMPSRGRMHMFFALAFATILSSVAAWHSYKGISSRDDLVGLGLEGANVVLASPDCPKCLAQLEVLAGNRAVGRLVVLQPKDRGREFPPNVLDRLENHALANGLWFDLLEESELPSYFRVGDDGRWAPTRLSALLSDARQSKE